MSLGISRHAYLPAYYDAVRQVAREQSLSLIDHYRNWLALWAQATKLFEKYVPDTVHVEPEGCEKVVTPAILRGLGFSPRESPGPNAERIL